MQFAVHPSFFTVPLTPMIHEHAQVHCQACPDWHRAEQIYLNSLAISAVNAYLQGLGFTTDRDASDSADALLTQMLNVADLMVQGCGRLECRPVLPDQDYAKVPEETWDDRIGYVMVQLSDDLDQATLLGFTPTVSSSLVAIDDLVSLADLPNYLVQAEQRNARQAALAGVSVQLRQWLSHTFSAGWQALEDLRGEIQGLQPALAFRSPIETESIAEFTEPNGSAPVQRGKIIRLGSEQNRSIAQSDVDSSRLDHLQIALLLALSPKNEGEVDICVELRPTQTDTQLPTELQIMILDRSGIEVMQARARQTKDVRLRFSGTYDEQFSLKLALGEISYIEQFTI